MVLENNATLPFKIRNQLFLFISLLIGSIAVKSRLKNIENKYINNARLKPNLSFKFDINVPIIPEIVEKNSIVYELTGIMFTILSEMPKKLNDKKLNKIMILQNFKHLENGKQIFF